VPFGMGRPCRIAGQEIVRLKVGSDGLDVKKILGKRCHGRAIGHGQTVPHCWPAKCEWTVLIGPVQSSPGIARSGPVQDRSGTGPVLGPLPTPNSVFGPSRSGPGPMHTPSFKL